jgi:preprotein translocase subunit SecB
MTQGKTAMSDEQLAPVFQIQRIYLKDMSLEQPNSPAILTSQEQPAVDIQLAMGMEQIAEGMVEVSVTATVKAQIEDKTVFLVEVKQAGIFEIRNLPQDQMGPVVGIACPQIIYPYLRSNVADVIQRAGFPPVHLSEINFQSMYEQQQATSQ